MILGEELAACSIGHDSGGFGAGFIMYAYDIILLGDKQSKTGKVTDSLFRKIYILSSCLGNHISSDDQRFLSSWSSLSYCSSEE